MNSRNSKQYLVVLATIVALVGLTVNVGMIPADSAGSHIVTGENHPMAPVTYNITFHQSGLAKGLTFAVTLSTIGTNYGTDYDNFTGLINGTYTFTVSNAYSPNGQNEYLPNPSSGTIILNGKNQNVQVSYYNQTISAPVSSKTFDLNFSITNLPSLIPNVNWAWTAYVNGIDLSYSHQVNSDNALAQFTGLSNGTYQYSLSFPSGTSLSPQTGQFTIDGKNISISLTFSMAKLYRITFSEAGLPADATFTTTVYNFATGVSLSNTTLVSKSNFVTFALVNQSYTYAFSTDAPFNNYYTASPPDGQIIVNGASFTVGTNFATSQHTYGIMFKIANPPSNSPGSYWYWSAIVNGTFVGYYSYNTTLLAPGLINGTYSFVIEANEISLTPVIGTFTVNGSLTIVSLEVQKSYTITFNAKSTSKLFSHACYSANITTMFAGIMPSSYSPLSTTTGMLTFTGIPNGTYNYVLTPILGWSLSNSQGTITVSGKNVIVNFTATPEVEYPVVFTESGLVTSSSISTSWGVVVDSGFFYNDSSPVSGLSHHAAPAPYTVEIPNGTYWVQAYVYQGGHYYFTQPQQISVNGQAAQYNIQFPTASGQPQSGITSSIVALIIVVVIAAAVIGLLAYNSHRKKTGP
ncbi:MAG: hypothetical protein M1138_05580 [Candidatus Thermoplasmatota archaeon]|nr:hypothetical protein [Candidatus Thermoplasmatota archaeon]